MKSHICRLKTRISFFIFYFLLSLSGVRSADNDLTVKVSGLRIVALTDDAAVRAFNWSPGTSIALLVKSQLGGLIQFDAKNSALSKCIDDKGNNLLAKSSLGKNTVFGSVGFGRLSKVSTDGKSCALEVNCPNTPVKGATAINLEGEIDVLTATKKKEYILTDTPIQDGNKITAGNLELTIQKVGKPEWGDEPLALTFRAACDLDEVAEIKFFKADGAEIKAHRVGSSKIGVLGSLTVEWNYNLSEKIAIATIKIFVWTDLQHKKAPFNLTVDVGL